MEIKLSKAGNYQYLDASHRWTLAGDGYYETTLAGQRLKAVQYEDGRIRLDYMGYECFGFESMEQARKSAQEFALQVLELVKQRILDFPPVEPRPVMNLVISDDLEP
ncbi:hypothetical protein [Pseudomonas amygdali]|uniref:Uncharacterized protein n=2 Tax=Pseudomonas amygdali pv. lachrymans TaxID=53707 RepID=A0ABR5KRX8_PSEAV|nr:hypothetical protein [Pseudomonas amygdali]AXH59737.1 hypothetical protein PLA107_031435 [Pseudomonas amygdali pv. lachrymans str. M301315]KPC17159.1 Uncharacterized protein AC499_0361 [Pseudomonas amygdali pv. lachrymans]KPC18118.1 Uncharacterized protein AC499_1320 [Pseudomonas amygdali pv. lachrymans]RMT06209.1 hypothetical protein ALP54_03640 [Pseudomonas amygdali pv. lachrymans]